MSYKSIVDLSGLRGIDNINFDTAPAPEPGTMIAVKKWFSGLSRIRKEAVQEVATRKIVRGEGGAAHPAPFSNRFLGCENYCLFASRTGRKKGKNRHRL
jgi:hypothetical protein